MRHYVAIFVQTDVGEWRVVFPDLPGCEAKGFSLMDAKFAATSVLARCIHAHSGLLPEPMNLNKIERSGEWLSRNRVDLSRAVISMIPIAV